MRLKKAGGNFKILPEGSHLGLCYQIIDLGTQADDFQGKRKAGEKPMDPMRRVWFRFEIPDERAINADGEDVGPMSIHREAACSASPKGFMIRVISALQGHGFSDNQLNGDLDVDLYDVLGEACLLKVEHYKKNNGDIGDKIADFASVPKRMQASVPGEVENEYLYLSLEEDEFDSDAFDRLPEFLQKKIMLSPEWAELQGTGHQSAAGPDEYEEDDDEEFTDDQDNEEAVSNEGEDEDSAEEEAVPPKKAKPARKAASAKPTRGKPAKSAKSKPARNAGKKPAARERTKLENELDDSIPF